MYASVQAHAALNPAAERRGTKRRGKQVTTLGRIRPRCGYPGRVAPTGAIVPGMRDEHHDVVRLPASASGAPCRRSKRSCNAGEVAPCQASEWAKVAQAAVSCATRAAAALDAPHSRTICAIMRLIAVRARPVASTDRLHRRQHRLARVAPSSWLDSQQHLNRRSSGCSSGSGHSRCTS